MNVDMPTSPDQMLRDSFKTAKNNPDMLNTVLRGVLFSHKWEVDKFAPIADDALIAAKRACELTNYEHPSALFYLSYTHLLREEFPEATKRFQEIDFLRIDDKNELNRLAWKVVDSGNKEFFNTVADEVLQAAVRACELSNYSDGAIIDTLAKVHFERGEIEDAVRWQKEAVKYATDKNREQFSETLAQYEEAD